eukprot:9471734-Prorocentrum_lima.AAC.1
MPPGGDGQEGGTRSSKLSARIFSTFMSAAGLCQEGVRDDARRAGGARKIVIWALRGVFLGRCV